MACVDIAETSFGFVEGILHGYIGIVGFYYLLQLCIAHAALAFTNALLSVPPPGMNANGIFLLLELVLRLA